MAKVFLIICCIFFGWPQTCFALTITFKTTATVEGSTVTLGDIVTFDEKSDLTEALGSKEVGQSPPPGETIYLQSFAIQQHLAANQTLPADIQWQGSPTVALYRSGITINSTRILEIISDFIEERATELPEADIRFVQKSLPLPFIVPHGNLTYEVIPSHPGILRSSRFSIIFKVDNRVVRNMSVKGKVEAFASVVVSTRRLRKGDIIEPQHVTYAKKNISKMVEPNVNPNVIIGKKLKKSLKAGEVILASMVETLPVVQRGERVKIVIRYENMVLTATGLSHNNGKLNDVIRVQNINSKKMVLCRVTAPGLVEVLL